jgi:phospholipid/cholesterol/gamma-HCH transport system substrate-binding protein
MITRTEKFRLGLFMIASLLMLIITVAVLVGTRMYEPRDRYTIRFDESVSGLDVGAQVKLSGVRVGQVEDIRIDRRDSNVVVVTVSLRKKTPIRSDSEAVLHTLGITGLKFIEIHGGTSRAELLKPGSTIKAGISVLGELEGKAQDIAVKTEMAVNRINEVMSEKNIRNLDEILANVKSITGRFDGVLEKNGENIDAIIADFTKTSRDLKEVAASAKRSSERLEQLVQSQQPKIEKIVDNVNETTLAFKSAAKKLERVDDVLGKIDSTLRELNTQIASARVGEIAESTQEALRETAAILKSMRRIMQASRLDIYRSVRSLKRTLDNMEQFSAEIRENPSLLLGSSAPEERDVDE